MPATHPANGTRKRRLLFRWCARGLVMGFVLNLVIVACMAFDRDPRVGLLPIWVTTGEGSISSRSPTSRYPPGPGLYWVYGPPAHRAGVETILAYPSDGSRLVAHRDTPRLDPFMPVLRTRPAPGSLGRSGTGPPSRVTLYGWPVHSFCCIRHPTGQLGWAVELDGHHQIPLRPSLLGVALDTLALAPFGIAILLLARSVRRVCGGIGARGCRADGICITPHCGYPVTGFDVCPECGTPQRPRRAAPGLRR